MSSKDPSLSDSISVDVHILSCGHGDTLLLCFPGNKWVLIDCYLPEKGGVRQRFFEFIQAQGIKRLELVFLTHPHYDHFLGMAEVLEHFSQPGRSLGSFCDGGMDAQQVRDLLSDGPGSRAYERLQDMLDRLNENGAIGYRQVSDGCAPIPCGGFERTIALMPVAPDAGHRRRTVRDGVRKLRKTRNPQLEANALSVVLVLSVKTPHKQLNALLAADAGPDEIGRALSSWRKACEEDSSARFAAVKIPHHGSLASHHKPLCERWGADGVRVAMVSAGARKALPDRLVLQDYLDNRWTILTTAKRTHKEPRVHSPFDLADRKPRAEQTLELHNLTVRLDGQRGLFFGPDDARIDEAALHFYESATFRRR